MINRLLIHIRFMICFKILGTKYNFIKKKIVIVVNEFQNIINFRLSLIIFISKEFRYFNNLLFKKIFKD